MFDLASIQNIQGFCRKNLLLHANRADCGGQNVVSFGVGFFVKASVNCDVWRLFNCLLRLVIESSNKQSYESGLRCLARESAQRGFGFVKAASTEITCYSWKNGFVDHGRIILHSNQGNRFICNEPFLSPTCAWGPGNTRADLPIPTVRSIRPHIRSSLPASFGPSIQLESTIARTNIFFIDHLTGSLKTKQLKTRVHSVQN